MGRAPCCEKVGLKRGRWTAEEDEILTNYIQANGEGSWRSLPKNAGLLRCGKSCRLRWINYLRSDLKRGNITAAEEDVIIKLHAQLGNRWSLIAGHLAGRTDNEIKNYWNSHLSRKIHSFRRLSNENLAVAVPVVMDLTKASIAAKRRGGRTSRSAMKKNKSYVNNIIPAPELSTEKPFPKDIQSGVMEGMVPIMPTTPTLEKEATSWNTNDIVVVDPWATEEEEGRNNLSVLSDSQRGMSGSSDDDQERENNILMSCHSSDHRNSELELVGSYEGLDSPMLCFNDIMGDDLQELGPDGYLTTGKEGETINNAVGGDERENRVTDSNTIKEVDVGQRGNLSSKGDHSSSSDWYSCTTSTNSCMEDIIRADWDWDFNNDWDMGTVVQGHHLPRDVEEEEKTSWTSLWESYNLDKDSSTAVMLGEDEIHCDKHEALVAWLLS